MHRFKTIGLIIQLDKDNSCAIARTVVLAKQNNATVFVICPTKTQLLQTEQQQITKLLKSKITCDYELVFLIGHPVIEITQFSANHNIDLLMMVPDIEIGLKHFFLGSITMSLLRKAVCPIWVIKTDLKASYQRILISLDPAIEDDEKCKLNNKLIEIGTSLAKRESAECHLVSAWHLPGESTLKSPFLNTSQAHIDSLKLDCKKQAAHNFQKIQATNRSHLEHCQTHLIYGNPAQAITEFVRKYEIDLVVMGTIARSGIKGFVIGNTAEAIINQLDCSIMAIKPDGFISPLLSSN